MFGLGVNRLGSVQGGLVSPYEVLGAKPNLILDFIRGYYKGVGDVTLDAAHSRSSAATMVDATGTLITVGADVPRQGHHIYDGASWVNKGLLHESEARTNLVTYSEDFSDASWTKSASTVTDNVITGPDGQASGSYLIDSVVSYRHSIFLSSFMTQSMSLSVYAKAGELTKVALGNGSNAHYAEFDLSSGSVITASVSSISNGQIENVGNGWYRCSCYFTYSGTAKSPAICLLDASGNQIYSGSGSDGLYIYGAQLEAASTPSSYIPTSGSTATRAADVLTIPAANMPWPQPQYISPELVENGTFDSDLSGWTDVSEGVGSTAWDASGYIGLTTGVDSSNEGRSRQEITTTIGAVYVLDITRISGRSLVSVGTTQGGQDLASTGTSSADLSETLTFTAPTTSAWVELRNFNNFSATSLIDNISVREINPLSVSIQMDGLMTYADANASGQVQFVRWPYTGGANNIQAVLDTGSTLSGTVRFQQVASSVADLVSAEKYSPGLNVPYNIASRHGSTFINGAVDGVALAADTTPTALPDLSNIDLTLGNVYMGTISKLRVWAEDIGDDGIAEATLPSTEPTLSLSFDSSESSFINGGYL